MPDSFDAVVVGGGLAGLTAGAVLAQRGLEVVVLEQASEAGGYAHSFERDGFVFDPAIHVTWEARPGQVTRVIFEELGVASSVRFIETNSFYDARFPGFNLRVPAEADGFAGVHAEAFPAEAENFRRFLSLCAQMHQDAHDLATVPIAELDTAVKQFPTLFEFQNATVADVLGTFVVDARLRAVSTAAWPYLGTPPSRLSFLTWAQILSVSAQGTFYCEGGFQSLVDALEGALKAGGGELRVNERVTRILVEDGRAQGVECESGERLFAPHVISNADATATLRTLVGDEHLPAPFVRRLERRRPSMSAFTVFCTTDHDLRALGVAHDTFLYRDWSHDTSSERASRGEAAVLWMNIPTIADPSLAPPNQHVVILTALVAYDMGEPWSERKDRLTDEIIAGFADEFPGLGRSLRVRESATPRALARYTGNRDGAMLGWETTPQNSGSRRLRNATPVDGLYLAGHWTQPGAGSLRVLVSGVMAAQQILTRTGRPPFEIPLAITAVWKPKTQGAVR